ncbi:MAG: hypothetical protein ABJG94_15175, partial [Nitratireductor sp.]
MLQWLGAATRRPFGRVRQAGGILLPPAFFAGKRVVFGLQVGLSAAHAAAFPASFAACRLAALV